MNDSHDLFGFMQDRIRDVGTAHGLELPQAFGRWFAEMYYLRPQDIHVPDGARDGKVDLFFKTSDDESVTHHILNSKFTRKFQEPAPVAFYDEITRFWNAFAHRQSRAKYLETVRSDLRARYRMLFERYDDGAARLIFLTNHRRNAGQFEAVKSYDIDIFHLEDLLQFMLDHIEDAMPRTPPLLLGGIGTILSPDRRDTEVPTSIVFAKVADLISYVRKDPFGLLFARNVRLWLGNRDVNREIRNTFESAPKEFVFSNNGITMLCERHSHDPGSQELRIENPRVVNGAQTLHSVRDVERPNPSARVMVRIIEVPPLTPNDLRAQAHRRKEIIHKISTRSNRQNPIKKWNLVSTDDFQNSTARFLRGKRLFYERRQNEWNYRKAELRSVGVKRGPDIRLMAQLIASYSWRKPHLGPAIAHGAVGMLFEDAAYGQIKETEPELAYQLFLLSDILDWHVDRLAWRTSYIDRLKGHAFFAVFTIVVNALESVGVRLGDGSGTLFFEQAQSQDDSSNATWDRLVKAAFQKVYSSFRSAEKLHRRMDETLSPNNFFKSQTHVMKIVSAPVSSIMRKSARKLMRSRSSPG